MTDNVKLDLYNAIEAALIATGAFKNTLHYNAQMDNDPKEKRRRFPQAWIEFSSIEWQPSKQLPENPKGTQEQTGAIQITIHVVTWSLSDDNDTVKPDLALTNTVYRALTMLEGDGWTPLQRINEIEDISQDNVRDWQIVFSTAGTECGVALTVTDAAPVTVKILDREE